MRKFYIYSIIAIVVILTMSVLKGYTIEEGFQINLSNIKSRLSAWFTSEYFIIPLIMTVIVGPIVYFIYTRILRYFNKKLTAVANTPASSNSNE